MHCTSHTLSVHVCKTKNILQHVKDDHVYFSHDSVTPAGNKSHSTKNLLRTLCCRHTWDPGGYKLLLHNDGNLWFTLFDGLFYG